MIPTSELADLAVTADGSIVFSAELNDHGDRDLLIGELTADGEPRTSHRVKTGSVTHSRLAVDAGGMFLAGGFAGDNDGHTYPLELDLGTGPHPIAGGYDLVVAGFAAPDAPASWTNQVRGAENDFTFDLALDPVGDVIVVGDVGPGLDFDGTEQVPGGARFGAPIAPGFEFLGYAVTTLDRDGNKRGEVFVDHVTSGPFRMALAPDGSLALGGFIGELPNEDTFIAVLDR